MTLAAVAIMAENYSQSDPASYVTLRPMQHLSYTSKLIDIAAGGKHHDVKVDPVNLRQLIAWVDTNCPYRGEEDIRAIPHPDFPGIEQLPIRPRVATAPVVQRPWFPQPPPARNTGPVKSFSPIYPPDLNVSFDVAPFGPSSSPSAGW